MPQTKGESGKDLSQAGAEQLFNLRAAVAVVIASLFLVYGAIFFQLRHQLIQGYSDFISFYTAGKILQRGAAHQLYDLGLQYDIQREVAPNVKIRKAALPLVRPPFEAWLFFPLAYLPYGAAFILWNLFSCGCLLAAVLILRQELPELSRFSLALTVLAAFSYFPVFVTLLQGQDSLLLLLIYVIAYKELSRHRYFAAGMVLGLGFIKFTLLLPFLVLFLVRKQIGLLFGFLVTSLLLLGISVMTVGLSTAAYYPKFLLSIDKVATGVNVPRDMPNVRGLLTVLTYSQLTPRIEALLVGLISLLLLAFAISRWNPNVYNAGAGLSLGFSLNLVTTILVSYHCHSFDLCLLMLPICLLTRFLLSADNIPSRRKLLLWSLGLVAFSPLYMVFSFVLKYPALISVLVLIFVFAIGIAISELNRGRRDNLAANSGASF